MIRNRSAFFQSQRQARWRWPWLALSILSGTVAAIVGAGLLFALLFLIGRLGLSSVGDGLDLAIDEQEELATEPVHVVIQLALIGAIFWPAAIAATLVHGRPIRSLLAPLRRFRWTIVGRCLSLQVGLVLFGVAVSLPWIDGVRFNQPSIQTLVWVLPLALVTFFQTSSEDAFFKGYLLRQFGAAVTLWWLAPIAVTTLFVSLHIGNTDVSEALWLLLPYFVISELFIIYLVMRTGGMEAALTTHWWNNFFIFFFLAEAATQSNNLTLYVFDEDPSTSFDEAIAVGSALVGIALQFVGFTWRRSPFFLEPHGWVPPPDEPPPPIQRINATLSPPTSEPAS